MNMPFILVVCFGVLCVCLVIVFKIFDARIRGTSKPVPWMRWIRQFQNESENAGWQIRKIPDDDTSRPMSIDTGWAPLVGMLGFFSGLALTTYDDRKYVTSGLILASSSFVVCLGGGLRTSKTSAFETRLSA